MTCFTSLHYAEVLPKPSRNLQNRISACEWNTLKCKAAVLNSKNCPKNDIAFWAKMSMQESTHQLISIVRGHCFGRKYCVIISCEAWPRQKKEHVECNVETCADMCLWRSFCLCFTIFGGLRFGLCFLNGFGMPFCFQKEVLCRFQVC